MPATPRAIWSGAISFGLVNVPVKLYGAVTSKDVRFNQLEKSSGARIRYRKVSAESGDEVAADEIVKGYEISPGSYVVLDPDELAALKAPATHTIEIEEFVELSEIDPIFFNTPYYIAPDKKGEKAYQLLVDTMAELDKAAIGRVIIRTKEYLAAIRPVDGVLTLETLRFADEVVDPADLGIERSDSKVTEAEIAMAHQLIETLSQSWEPEKFSDDYREQVLGLIERKADGQEIVAEPEVAPTATVTDLMAALEASIDASQKSPAKPSKAKRRAKKAS